MKHVEEIIESMEYIITLKEKNMKNWEEIFPSFNSLARESYKELKKFNMIEDMKKILSYVKPLNMLPPERQTKRLNNLKTSLIDLKNKYLISQTTNIKENKLNLFTDIKYIKHVGTKRGNLLKNLNIENIYDALYTAPRDWEDRRKVKTIYNISDGETALIVGKVANMDEVNINKGLKIINFSINDGTGIMTISFFNQDYIKNYLKKDTICAFYGKAEYNFGQKQMKSPDFQILENKNNLQNKIIPIYPLTSGISQNIMRKIMKQINPQIYYLEEFLPDKFIKTFNLLNINQRLTGIHEPKSSYHIKKSLITFKYEEIFLFEYAILNSKKKIKKHLKGYSKNINGELSKIYINNLNFKLTNAQKRTHIEIREDMKKESPMNRLLQGDVGSGKTAVAEISIIDNFEAGFQSALMVPTSVLAKQQYQKIKLNLEKINIKTELLIGETKEKEKKEIKDKLKNGEIDLIIGTHAIIQNDVEFKKLGLIIIDEQHRFGVNQRLSLIQKGSSPDILVMTATPIPRTLALTLYGDLDVSIIDEMPSGRKKVKTILNSDNNLKNIYDFIKDELKKENQAFFIYPLIEESEAIDLKNAKDMHEQISKIFSDYNVGLLHGKMKSVEKNEIMEKFSKKEINILVSTTVIEVGVDIPDATVMVIEHADRFGLSQLHQLRGRVGRSSKQSYCFLTTSSNISKETKTKLTQFSANNDGFKVSEIDLKWRGPGKFFGTQQHGIPDFKFIDITEDLKIIEEVKKYIEQDNILDDKKIIQEIKMRFKNSTELIKAI
ncbi:MAG: ATP-dependent helicase RecG [Oceanotoga sp.]|uniref:ATP-dependent DNA helicase RecG n=1 Tax=Oceanotoga sp. TaxID=2108366 RepID=UPI0026511D8C|nr:ATP-dependent DNA helicase RecG [Oceanotoga sp.]MDN5343594.1 ATP-dependent helicase RecG [Oceanotoga sp.]